MAKGVISGIVLAIIGGAIMTVLLMILFSSFSSPFLEFMADSENTKNFNKFTGGLSTACSNGIDTEVYMSFSYATFGGYFVSALGNETATYLQSASKDYTSKNSRLVVKKCMDDYCYCLLSGKVNGVLSLAIKQKAVVKELKEEADSETAYYKSPFEVAYVYLGYTSSLPAQSFTASKEGVIKYVLLKATVDDPNNFNSVVYVDIYAADPYGLPDPNKFMGYAQISADSIANSKNGWINVTFTSDVFLDKGTEYFIILNSSNNLNLNSIYWNASYGSKDTTELNRGSIAFYDEGEWKSANDVGYKLDSFGFDVWTQPLDETRILKRWDSALKSALTERSSNNPFGAVDVLQCRRIVKDLNCRTEDTYGKLLLPTIENNSHRYVLLWLQPFTINGPDILSGKIYDNLWFDSYTFERPLNETGQFRDYVLSITSPPLADFFSVHEGGPAPIKNEYNPAELLPTPGETE